MSQADEGHVPHAGGDVATDLVEEEMNLTFLRAERARLDEVDDALRRIASGSYGQCEECGTAIDPGRLVALPWARECLACAADRSTHTAESGRGPVTHHHAEERKEVAP